MSAIADILKGIEVVWQDLLKMQEALSQLKQYKAVTRLGELANELNTYIANRTFENERRIKEDEKIQRTLVEAHKLLQQAEEIIRKTEGRGTKSTRAKPVKPIKKARGQKIMRLSPIDGKILQTALAILKGEKEDWNAENWEMFRKDPIAFLGKCFGGKPVYVLETKSHLDYLTYLKQGFFAKYLKRIVAKYQDWFDGQFVLPLDEKTLNLFEAVRAKIGNVGMLNAMFEVMLDQSLEEAQTIGVEDQKSG